MREQESEWMVTKWDKDYGRTNRGPIVSLSLGQPLTPTPAVVFNPVNPKELSGLLLPCPAPPFVF